MEKQVQHFKLDEFEGPLDLLLHLIKSAKLDIKDIFISKITEQYLDYISNLEQIDMQKASEFIDMATTLLEIKSRSFLPQLVVEIESAESIENKLIRQLEEYKILKEAGEKLKTLENLGRFYKAPDPIINKERIQFKDFSLENLIEAFRRLGDKKLEQRIQAIPRVVARERFNITERIKLITELVKERRQVSFFSLFDDDYSQIEVVITFLSILELIKLKIIKAQQEKVFADIIINYNEEQITDTDYILGQQG